MSIFSIKPPSFNKTEIKKFKPDVKLKGSILIEYKFFYERPKSHYRTGKYKNLLKKNAPKIHTTKPDIDNLVKFVCDSLNGVCYRDDSQIVELKAEKHYTESGPRTEVFINEI